MKTIAEQFEKFASEQHGEYNYWNPDACACAQFCDAMGLQYCTGRTVRQMNRQVINNALEVIASMRPHYWHELARRLHHYNTTGEVPE